jgi:hypothetical protein
MHAFADPCLLLHLACLQVFYTTHILGFIGFVFFGLMHYYNNWMVMVPGGWGGKSSTHCVTYCYERLVISNSVMPCFDLCRNMMDPLPEPMVIHIADERI